MPLWRNTDAVASRPTWINTSNLPAGTQVIFVDETEAGIESNQTKGIKGPGWYTYLEYKDSDGQIRYKTELLAALSVPVAIAGDAADDLIVPDVQTTIAITVHPANQNTALGAATFAVTAASTPAGPLTYQWQRRVSGGRWTAVTGATAATLALTAQTAVNTGDQYRVVVSGGGARSVTSNPATLTFVA